MQCVRIAGGALRQPSESFAAERCSLQVKRHSIKTLHRPAHCLCVLSAETEASNPPAVNDVGGRWMLACRAIEEVDSNKEGCVHSMNR